MKIKPIKPEFTKPEVNNLTVTIQSDNLIDTCVFLYVLSTDDDIYRYVGRVTVSDTDYHDWDGNNNFPYQFVMSNLELEENTTETPEEVEPEIPEENGD